MTEMTETIIAIRLVPDHTWSPQIPGNLITIKCRSRQALNDGHEFSDRGHKLRQWRSCHCCGCHCHVLWPSLTIVWRSLLNPMVSFFLKSRSL